MKYLGIRYPFTKTDSENFYLDLNSVDTSEIKTLILHIMLTPKKQRYRLPSFGSDLLKFIFEPNDVITIDDIKQSLDVTLSTFIPGIKVDNVTIDQTDGRTIYVRLDYTVTEGVFTSSDFVEVTL